MAKKNFKQDISSGIDSLLQATQKETAAPQKREFVKYNYVIERNTHKALKIQSALEERPIIDILGDALNMYFDSIKKGI